MKMGSVGIFCHGSPIRHSKYGVRTDVQGTRYRGQPDYAVDINHHVPLDIKISLEPIT